MCVVLIVSLCSHHVIISDIIHFKPLVKILIPTYVASKFLDSGQKSFTKFQLHLKLHFLHYNLIFLVRTVTVIMCMLLY